MTKRDYELEAGATAHFEDPVLYAHTYAARHEDVAFYRRVAANHENILEYGIGNGRIAIPMARGGAHVTGIDRSAPMLRDLRERLKKLPADVRARIRARKGDMRRLTLGERFSLVICPVNTALHLYTRQDVESWLTRVRDHLEPRGEFVLDLSMPILEDLVDEPGTSYSLDPFQHPSVGLVDYREVFDYDRLRQILFVSMCFEPKSVNHAPFMIPLAQAQYFPREWETLLHYNGFETVDVHGDFAGGALTQDSDVMVWRARLRRDATTRTRAHRKPAP